MSLSLQNMDLEDVLEGLQIIAKSDETFYEHLKAVEDLMKRHAALLKLACSNFESWRLTVHEDA
uniref:Uncharacterized protein n=1 Tax=Arion vulgaris TaxID=1028688 RepID=A0A0B6Z6E2_9EUPU